MAIKSFIVYPQAGKKSDVANFLSNLPGCEVIPSENTEVLILITDTQNEAEDKKLEEQFGQMEYIQSLTLVSGFAQ
jgi:nitrate reductase NapAB chaperone NapD